MEINKKLFEFTKTKNGKKIHISPVKKIKNFALCLAVCEDNCSNSDIKNLKNEDICLTCISEYEKIKKIKSSMFSIFCT